MFLYSISALIVLLDQITKVIAQKFLPQANSLPVIPDIFHLTLVQNPGVAFGLFSKLGNGLVLLVVLCLIAIIVYLEKMRHLHWRERLPLALILGGAAGNLIDRVRLGHVVDFLDFRIWPVFNLADSFITAGVLLFLIAAFRKS